MFSIPLNDRDKNPTRLLPGDCVHLRLVVGALSISVYRFGSNLLIGELQREEISIPLVMLAMMECADIRQAAHLIGGLLMESGVSIRKEIGSDRASIAIF